MGGKGEQFSSRKIKKRDGTLEKFDQERISQAILKAANSVGGNDKLVADKISQEVAKTIFSRWKNPSIEDIQDTVEQMLIENGHAKTAKAYILYRQRRNEERAKRAIILGEGYEHKYLNFSTNALHILERRYLLKDENGKLVENPEQMMRRVARAVSTAEKNYNSNAKQAEDEFYQMLSNLDFLPNSPTLMNAGTKNQQLAACFVLPIEDSLESIFDTLKHTAIIHQSGGGTGFSFSRLRPKGDIVKSTRGVAAGPVAFMNVYNSTVEVIKQGGRRKGANMAVLNVDHPDIIEFITSKNDRNALVNFNISVGITDQFMEAVMNKGTYEIKHPKGHMLRKIKARAVFNLIVQNAWKNADPGILFIDRINKLHPAKNVGTIETTNPCGEQALLPYESCTLGSINLKNMVSGKEIDWDKLRKTVHTAIHFLDNVIDVNNYPMKEIEKATKFGTRKIGLGIMGFADMLFLLGIKYDSNKGVEMAEKVMGFIQKEAYKKSQELAQKRGTYPLWKGSMHWKKGKKMRNACCTTIAPTGTISMLAETTGGCEPAYALSYVKYIMGGSELSYTNKIFEQTAIEEGLYSTELMKKVARTGDVSTLEVPKNIRDIFVVSHNIGWEWHVRMQAAFQKHVDSSISKTINFPSTATVEDVEKAFLLAYNLGVKGITIYVDHSHELQVLNMGSSEEKLAQSSTTIDQAIKEIRK